MTAPRHLWSGDWELESSEHADDLAARRGRVPAPADAEPAQPEPTAPEPRENRIRRALRTLRARLRGLPRPSRPMNRRRVRLALLTTFLILLGATAAYAVISDSGTTKPTQTVVESGGSQPWLGVKLANAPVRGALVSAVVPNSPAAQAGIRPGDLITQLDTQPIVAPAVLLSAIDGLQPGNTVDIQLQRGASQYTARVTLASRPSKTP